MVFVAYLALQTSQLTVGEVLTKVRFAVSIQDAAPKEIQVTGKATYLGVDGDYTMRFQPNGQYVQTMRGPLQAGVGFDGQIHWQTDPSGFSEVELGEDAELADAVANLLTNRWLRRGALREAHLLASSGDPIVLIRGWGQDIPEKVTVDSSSWLPKAAEFATHAGVIRMTFSNWTLSGGGKLPFHSTVDQAGAVTTYEVEHATAAETISTYSVPKEQPQDFRYDGSVPPVIEAQSIRGHLFVHPKINGKDIGWFILDTCAEVMMIDIKAADSINLQKVGGSPITGIGGTIVEPFRIADEVTLGPSHEQHMVFSELDAGFLTKAFGIPVAGIVGADMFRRFVFEIDVEKPRVAIYDATKYQLSSSKWEPLYFFGGNPAVQATFEGDRTGYVELDTGSNNDIMVNSPFVWGFHLLDGRKQSESAVGGFGGGAESTGGVLEWLNIGGHRFEKLNAVFSLADQGALANPYVFGVAGEPVMKPFNIVYDFGHYRIAFLPK